MRKYSLRKLAVITTVVVLTVLAGACKKKVVPPPPVPTPAAATAKPTVSLKASPTFISTGQSSTLSWTSENATSLELTPNIGSVAAEGTTEVSPSSSTTYTITATGPGGTATDSARVTVGASPLPPAQPSASLNELFRQNVRDAFFDFNKADIRPDARDALSRDAEFLRSHAEINVTIEGHCDERGSVEYNLGLGQRRAEAAKEFLVSLGVAAARMRTMSWGKEHPFCTEHSETCWQENRRAHFVMAQ
jgi:peptidoglycan-associated lipoprotein